ncbi:hypothetical protein OA88_13280 [Flavobacterium sp. JRM]|nr:hypothetical protein OA88_13280 [Flavobacterium sp. JRM]
MFLIFSCKSQEDLFLEKFYGQWAIEEVEYNNVNYKEDLYVNFMVFEKNNKVLIPESVHFQKDMTAEWTVELSKDKKISINCIDVVFNGSYTVKFIKDQNKKLLGIEMKSDSTYIKAYKFFQNYDLHKDW